ncbi:hypothetical protein DOI34_24855 [Salmonella enterica subsp. enterica serovar Virchow]|nr:hypothetical protein [Salmonella enterica subsp. enterica serovar Virchow]MIL09268.1 hypothetical protein [Salmonella enterica subsp. enterica serovar Enteritidis]
MDRSFVAGLVADGPAEEYRDELMLYGQFVGNWRTETKEWRLDGSSLVTEWDVRFQWALEGRAIQDLWITPPRNGERVGWNTPGNRYSTTLRLYVPAINAWRIVWLNPPSGTITNQIGRKVGDEIIQLADFAHDGSLTRWVYRDIRRSAFRWCNERSTDNGATWRLVQEMRASRISDQ